jgi:PBSX family phage terminase large subunit
VIQLRREFLPKQLAFITATDPNVLYSGSVRAGKTYALCTKTAMRACVPGAREGLCRKHRVTLTATTLVTLLQGDGMNPPVLPQGQYTHNKVDGVIRINGGGEIVYFGLDDPAKIGSRSLTGVAIDEAAEVTETDWDMLQTRVSVEVPGLPRMVYGACNPGPPMHFLAKRFGLAAGHRAMAGHVVFRTQSAENWFLPRDYLDRIDTLTGVARRRLVLGEWCGAEGLVYDNWDRERHVRVREGPWVRAKIGCDDGFSNPFAALLVGVDSDGRMHVMAERYSPGLSLAQKIARIRELVAIEPKAAQELIVFDPSAAQLRAEVRLAGFATAAAENDVDAGIQVVRQRLEDPGDGMPRLTVDPSCENLIREFETYEYAKDPSGVQKDKPKKENDHACFVGSTRVRTRERGWVRIDSVACGEHVLTPTGFEPVLGAGQTGVRDVVEFEFESGNRVTCTPDHRFLTDEYRYASLSFGDGRSEGGDGDAAGLERGALVPVRVLLHAGEEGRRPDGATPRGVGSGERPDSRWLPRAPRERGPGGQPVGEPHDDARVRTHADAHDAGAVRGSARAHARQRHPESARVALDRSGAAVARSARRGRVAEAALSHARVRDLRQGLPDACEREAAAVHVLEQLQDDPVSAAEPRTDAAVRARVRGAAEVFCLATPSRCFVIEGGFVVHNCDALKYLAMSLRRASLGIA